MAAVRASRAALPPMIAQRRWRHRDHQLGQLPAARPDGHRLRRRQGGADQLEQGALEGVRAATASASTRSAPGRSPPGCGWATGESPPPSLASSPAATPRRSPGQGGRRPSRDGSPGRRRSRRWSSSWASGRAGNVNGADVTIDGGLTDDPLGAARAPGPAWGNTLAAQQVEQMPVGASAGAQAGDSWRWRATPWTPPHLTTLAGRARRVTDVPEEGTREWHARRRRAGRPGAGKTALLAAVAEDRRRAGGRVVEVTGRPLEVDLAFAALVELLSSLDSGPGSRVVREDELALLSAHPLRQRLEVLRRLEELASASGGSDDEAGGAGQTDESIEAGGTTVCSSSSTTPSGSTSAPCQCWPSSRTGSPGARCRWWWRLAARWLRRASPRIPTPRCHS